MKDKKRYIVLAAIFSILFLIFVIFTRVFRSKAKSLNTVYTTVLVRKAQYGSLKKFLDLYAELRADNEVELTSPVTGKILRFNKLEGDFVRRGQSVLFVDRFEIGAQYSAAPITSPTNGVITRILVSEGADVRIGTSVATVGNIDLLEALIQVPELYAPEIKIGQKVYFKARAIPGRIFEGVITRKDLSLNPETRSLTVRADIENKDRVLFSGIFAESFVFVDEAKNVFVFPESALTKTLDRKDAVFINKNDLAVLTPVTISLRYRDQVAISSGVTEGDQIIVFGREFLSDGSPIKSMFEDNSVESKDQDSNINIEEMLESSENVEVIKDKDDSPKDSLNLSKETNNVSN